VKTIVKYILRSVLLSTELSLALVFLFLLHVLLSIVAHPPEVSSITIDQRQKIGTDHYAIGSNFLKRNEFGVWEMYIEGDAYERGVVYGELAKELNQQQEDFFVCQINQFVPKGVFQNLLRLSIGYFTRSIPDHISLEIQQETYGISHSFSDKFDYIAPKYTRILSYHAAHDIGHALNDYSLVGCTSLALTGERTSDSHLLIGRNFDFYVGDDFAKNKILLFVNPTKGYKFVSYAWAGFIGVASGMNEHGLTVTINASKSDVPTSMKTPISILAREILQYAKNIDQAISIAKKRETFVSETILVGSSVDNSAVLIEKTPTRIDVVIMNDDQLICSNHYQSATFKHDSINVQNIQYSDSKYRYDRVQELIKQQITTFHTENVARILRDQYAQNNQPLGMGNPRAINQLIAHHSTIMQPEKRMMYVSTNNFQLGTFLGYNLTTIFQTKQVQFSDTIAGDPFLHSKNYENYKKFRKTKRKINDFLYFNTPLTLSSVEIQEFIRQNDESYVTYEMLGKYFKKKERFDTAIEYFTTALTKNVASRQVEKELTTLIDTCRSRK